MSAVDVEAWANIAELRAGEFEPHRADPEANGAFLELTKLARNMRDALDEAETANDGLEACGQCHDCVRLDNMCSAHGGYRHEETKR